ncbi:unnamed protein product [Rotaria sp. Silwood1]|nr:unnamed protein product [Rotaria sp. Silwood1]
MTKPKCSGSVHFYTKYLFIHKLLVHSCVKKIPPPYDEAIKIKSINTSNDNSNQQLSSIPIHSISLSVDQTINATTTISNEIVNQQQQQQLITNSSS